MKVLLLGRDGQVGWELERSLAPIADLVACSRQDCDLTHPEQLRSLCLEVKPDIIVNAAAYTNVDGAEGAQELALVVNAGAPELLAQMADQLGAVLIHYSTDYVFDGSLRRPYTETDPPAPINMYGETKLLGEQRVAQAGGVFLILRLSWVYSLRRDSFVTKVLRWARSRDVLRIAGDQYGSPTWCKVVAQATQHILEKFVSEDPKSELRPFSGTYHLACQGAPSRFELARATLELAPLDSNSPERTTRVESASAGEFPAAARRPAYSALDSSHFERTFAFTLPLWKEALESALVEGTPSQ